MVRSFSFTAALVLACVAIPAFAGPIYLAEELLPLPGDYFVQARAINAEGQVVGYSRSSEGRNSAVLWDAGAVIDLSPDATVGHGDVANDISDFGQIVGTAYTCEPSCPQFPDAASLLLHAGIESFGPEAWLTPESTRALPLLARCLTDDPEILISDSGRAESVGGVAGAMVGDVACGSRPTGLLENGVSIIPEGYLWEEPGNVPVLPDLGPAGIPIWVVVPSCDGTSSPYSFYGHGTVVDSVRTDVCNLVVSSYSRNRLQNASGQFFLNADGRAFLFSPISEPGSLALLMLALCALVDCKARRKSRGFGMAAASLASLIGVKSGLECNW